MRLMHRDRRRQAEPLLPARRWRSCRRVQRSSPSKASARPETCIRCKSPGWRMAARSAASARRASSCRRRCCSTRNKSPTREQVRAWFNRNRNLCRCTGYKPLADAVMDAAAMLRGEKTADQVLAKPKADGSILGTQLSAPVRAGQSHRHMGLRRRHCAAHAGEHAAPRARAGEGLATPSSRASTPAKPRRCPAS